jgi:hypothetical protein
MAGWGDIFQILWRPFGVGSFNSIQKHFFNGFQISTELSRFHSLQLDDLATAHQQYGRPSLSIFEKLIQP